MANMLPGSLCEQRSSDFPPSGWRPTTRGASGSGSARRTSTWGASPTCRPCERGRGRAPSGGRGRPRCLRKSFDPCRRRPRWRVVHLRGPNPQGDGYELGPEFWEFKIFPWKFLFLCYCKSFSSILSAKVISDWPRFSMTTFQRKLLHSFLQSTLLLHHFTLLKMNWEWRNIKKKLV